MSNVTVSNTNHTVTVDAQSNIVVVSGNGQTSVDVLLGGIPGTRIIPLNIDYAVPSDSVGVNGDYVLDISDGIWPYLTGPKANGTWVGTPQIWLRGEDGAAGDDGEDANMWLGGSIPPEFGVGEDGDLYLNASTGFVYLKSGFTWNIIGSILGPQGPQGDTGATGATGATGPQGPAYNPSPTIISPTWSISGAKIEASFCEYFRMGQYWCASIHLVIKLNETAGAGAVVEMNMPTISGSQIQIDGNKTVWLSNSIDATNHGKLPRFGDGSQFRPGIGWKPYLDVVYSTATKIKFNHIDGYLLDNELISNSSHYAAIKADVKIPIQGWS